MGSTGRLVESCSEMTRRTFIGSIGAAAAQQARRPNIVVIVADDLGIGDVGCYGADDARTPHLDRMAVDGIRFTDFHANSPVCSPSRASLLTGQYPQRNHAAWRTEETGLPYCGDRQMAFGHHAREPAAPSGF
jgi:arylsulfatase A-like enzyme